MSDAAPRVVAVGAGRMGRSIAVAFAWAGHRIAVVDLRPRDAAAWNALRDDAQAEVRTSLQALADLGALAPGLVDTVAARISWVPAHEAPAALAQAEAVFEGVTERLDVKRETFATLGRLCRADAILASTTSSILVTELAATVEHPERFLNAHWLNPAYVIPVVEISTHPGTSPDVLERTRTLLESIGKVPVVCGPTPGYIVPRLQALVMNEAARMVEEGAATPEEIDKATRYGLGLRFSAIGVVEFIDWGGADILHHASREMSASIDAARYRSPPVLDRLVAEGHLGLKTGRGFFDYESRDLAAYRRDVLERTLGALRQAGLWRPAADDTVA